jgi:DNA-directed RNA polymerase subunit H (RpoH/RPB5)
MSQSSNRILSIYKSRNTIIEQLRILDYNVAEYENFSINEIDTMCKHDQLDMLVTRESDKHKIYVKYLLNAKQIQQNILNQLVEDLYEIENILEKKDTLMIVSNEEPNDTITSKIKYLFDNDQIFIVIHYIKRLQFNILNHVLVPKSRILSTTESEDIKTKYNLQSLDKLPEISRFDPQALSMCLRPKQVIEINRKSDTALEYKYYRICV